MGRRSATHYRKYTLKDNEDASCIVIDSYQREHAITHAMSFWKRVSTNFDEKKENHHEHLGENGLLIVDTQLDHNNDIEIHSYSEEGLERSVKDLGLPLKK